MRNLYFLITLSVILLLVSFHGTQSYFSDSAVSGANTFATASEFQSASLTPVEPTPSEEAAQVLVINEIIPDSSCSQGNNEAQWIEIYNGYATTVNLKNFKITDGTNTIDLVSAASVNIAPDGFVLLSHNSSIFGTNQNSCYNDNGTTTANLGGSLNIDVGTLQLLDSDDNIIDVIQWGGATGLNPSQNQSVERVPSGIDTATGSSFTATDFRVREIPTPGYGTNVVLNEFIANNSPEWVELYNLGPNPVNLTGWKLEDLANTQHSITSLGTISVNGFATLDVVSGWLNNVGPEKLYLKDSSNKIIDSHAYTGSLGAGQSVGKLINGGNIWQQPCTTPTKNSSNNGSC